MNKKYCEDCKHYKERSIHSPYPSSCFHPDLLHPVNRVAAIAWRMREQDKYCGPDGKLWEYCPPEERNGPTIAEQIKSAERFCYILISGMLAFIVVLFCSMAST